MNGIAKLIRAKTIPFVEILMRHYHTIGLDETNAIIILKLYYLNDHNESIINIDNLANTMSISKKEIEKRIISLIQTGYLSLTLVNDKEEFNLDATFEKLGEVIDTDEKSDPTLERKEKISSIVEYIESTYQKVVSSTDLITINSWIDANFPIEEIKKAVFESLKARKLNLRYADTILLTNMQQKEVKEDVDQDELTKILDRAYVKRR